MIFCFQHRFDSSPCDLLFAANEIDSADDDKSQKTQERLLLLLRNENDKARLHLQNKNMEQGHYHLTVMIQK